EPFVLMASMGYLFWLDARLALLSLVLFPVCIVPVALFGRRVRRFAREGQQKLADITSTLQETITGVKIVKAYGMEERESRRFAEQAKAVFGRVMKVTRASAAIDPIVVSISFAGLSLALVYARWIGMSFDEFFTFGAALVMMYQPVKKISKLNMAIQQGSGAAEYWRLIAPLRRFWQQCRGYDDVEQRVGNLIDQGFAKRISLPERMRVLRAKQTVSPSTAREEHHAILTSGLIPYAFELTDKTSMAFAIESRHPFADRRLVEFCLALPPQQKLQQGWIRMIVRRALSDVLPEKITWRGGKTVNSPAVTAAFGEVKATLLQEIIMSDPGPLEAYVNIVALREIYQRYQSKQDLHDELLIWQVVTLALWLRYTGLGG
ncbi:MAG: hypothetical protein HGA71_20570, partial [Azonexaceae bacterium]|nr:hypothetical protein [Azonexaceae bacterium]